MLKETSLAGAGSLSWGGYWHGRGGEGTKREAVCGSPSITPGSRPWFFPTALVMNRHPAPRDNPAGLSTAATVPWGRRDSVLWKDGERHRPPPHGSGRGPSQLSQREK